MQVREPNRLGQLIKASPKKQSRIAADLDVDQSTLYRWRTGESPIDDGKKAEIARYFGVTRAYLMGWDADVPSEKAA